MAGLKRIDSGPLNYLASKIKERPDGKIKHNHSDRRIDNELKRIFLDGIQDGLMLPCSLQRFVCLPLLDESRFLISVD
jgi:hypothetical protein